MGAVKKSRKQNRIDLQRGYIVQLNTVITELRKKEGMLLRALYEVHLNGSSYAGSMLKQMYGNQILDSLNDEIDKAEKKAKGLDKIVLTGTEAME